MRGKLLIILLAIAFSLVGGFFAFLGQDYLFNLAETENNKQANNLLFDIKIDGLNLEVELADTAEKRERGLSGRNMLGENQGMFFAFDKPDFYFFWMKDMKFPIDIFWLDKNLKIVHIQENVEPSSYPKKFISPVPAQYVLEVNAGWSKMHKIEIGMRVSLNGMASYLNIKPEEPKTEVSINDIVAKEEKLTSKNEPISPNVLESGQNDNTDPQTINSQILLLDVPFTSQAPFGNWSDPRRENGCEEASAIMAMAWVRGEKLTSQEADKKITEISDYELENFGDFHDTSAQDTAIRIFNGFYGYQKIRVEYDIDAADIKRELENGNLLAVPVYGQKLKNPYYTQPGPIQHMIVIRGYDSAKKEFITNDPGTRHGDGFRYKEDILEMALQDYPSGVHLPITDEGTAMIVVEK